MFERLAPEQHDTLEGVREPSENSSLVGHGEAAGTLAGAHKAGKLPHALMLTGPRGIGKATFAFHLARHLLDPAARAAGAFQPADPASALFRQVAMGAHPGVMHLTRPFDEKNKKFKTVISVDEVRRVGRFLSMTAHDGGYRIVIVDPADDMNINAANALLKNLEEPPSRTAFLLIVHSEGGLLPTIRSRCQIIRLAPLDTAQLGEALAHAAPDSAGFDAALLARAGGSVRDAILLGAFGGLEIADTLDGLTKAVDVATAHRLADAVAARGEDIRFALFNTHALDVLAAAAGEAAREGGIERAARLAQTWQDAQKAIMETDTYNLDRKQHALTMIDRLQAMRM